MLLNPGGSLCAIRQAQLAVSLIDVRLDRMDTYVEAACNGMIREPLGYQSQDPFLLLGKCAGQLPLRCVAAGIHIGVKNVAWDPQVAVQNFPHASDHIFVAAT